MPRTPPWLTGGEKAKREPDLPAPAIKRTSSPRLRDETPTKKDFVSRKDFFKSFRFIREGLDEDDIYIMVEDEFYTVAQTFTRHLHYAEYVRSKKEAKVRNADTIADIARPTSGATPMSVELKKRYAADELEARQQDGLDALLGKQLARDGDPGDDPEVDVSWAGTHLQDFMFRPRKVRSLAGLQKSKPSTKAAAEFPRSSRLGSDSAVGNGPDDDMPVGEGQKEPAITDETTDDDDDLDAGVSQVNLAAARSSSTPSISGPRRTSAAVRLSKLTGPPSEAYLNDVGECQPPVSKQKKDTSSSELPRLPSSIRSPSKDRQAEVKKEQTTRPRDSLYATQARRRFVFDDSDEHFTASSNLLHWSSSSVLPGGQNSPGGIQKRLEATNPESTRPNITQGKRGLVPDDFDGLPEPRKPRIHSESQTPQFINAQQKKSRDKDTTSEKSRLNEVPTFLI
ncbi:hypothetical protein AN2182.2 [Aspergillus nidulans FGSC A4]|uniref:Uncharacterized protein n=1 Tax=Emericella nidulans (strain FGSC A4 / ATCC 38163 / CBS 112.46 / NRRL 194 / M139) TaxID=227321 RepID=Q5BB98_EMENI|nr:hypothetical protein [Aspergillus nidulans FGSC A4]EAA64226.1 hypothetical protein AN2182.2 [Aspergillus nidulans FGSC A4]CBF86338.1 TPA: conserved hypothetical protein [Aspergillus nidulans FGSC A4]|eukprot:XP_659786.1 hypothetical protein AN2182.2 [Aspergillus nidulans FGSC A4]